MTYESYLALTVITWLLGITSVATIAGIHVRQSKRSKNAYEETLRTASLHTNEQLAYMVYQLRNENEALRESLIGEFAYAVYQQEDREPDNDEGSML